jgi:Flp pilus assembly protein TadG
MRQRFLASAQGVAAVEFAIIVPILLMMLIGAVEIGTAIVIKDKVRTAASTLAQIANQYTTIHNSDMTAILGATAAIVTPYSTSPVSVVISEISINSGGSATVSWSDTLQGTARAPGSSIVVPSAIAAPNTTLLLSEVSYLYQPTLGYVMTGALTLQDSLYVSPRSGSSIARAP